MDSEARTRPFNALHCRMRMQACAASPCKLAQGSVIFRRMQAAVFIDENATVVVVRPHHGALLRTRHHMHGHAGFLAQHLALMAQPLEMAGSERTKKAAG